MAATLRVYGAKTCPDTQRARKFLEEHDEDEAALALIKSVNNGNRTTPTIFFEDGEVQFESTNDQLAAKLGL